MVAGVAFNSSLLLVGPQVKEHSKYRRERKKNGSSYRIGTWESGGGGGEGYCEPGSFGSACEDTCPDGACGLFCGEKCNCDQRSQLCDISKCCVNVTSITCRTDLGMSIIILLLITAAYLYRNIKRLKRTLRDTNMQLIKCQMENDISNLKANQQASMSKEEKAYMEIGEVNIPSAQDLQDTSGYLLMEAVPVHVPIPTGTRYVEMNKWQSVENMIN
ncbi:hypothetical protein FSP39_023690 [Pinctada imbricata]|uniref:Uncharacterized protein n=1 Tax=Pinctada imbricata TaxID=66713 RepID=A0AA89BVE7_PINIB|nr:hypothetical protein FSP39_023690 [Pinctada imbricata]